MNERLRNIIGNALCVDIKEIKETDSLADDLNADSLDMIELTQMIEDEFQIEISTETIPSFVLVSDIELYLTNNDKPDLAVCDSMKPKFTINQKILHVKTGNIYTIKGLPAHYRIEATNVPAYAYLDEYESEDKIWIRPQTEMEDGRFESVGD